MDENTSRSEDDTGEEFEDSSSSTATTAVANLSSSSRQMRNQAEKLRRDKLNQFINELAALVPMVSSSAKRLDKTSILRLSAAFLRIHQILVNGKDYSNIMAYDPSPLNWCQCVLEGMDGVMLIVTAPGKIVFVSHNVENLIGHQQVELLGQSLYTITKIEDHAELKKNLKPDKDDDCEEVGTSSGVCSTRNTGSRRPQRRSFYIRLRQRSVSRSEQPQYETVHVVGQLRVPPPPSPRKHKTDAQLSNDIVLVAMVKPVRDKYISEYSLLEANKEEWTTRHLVDGTIVFSDHRISITSGYLSEEVTGTHAFHYMHKDDVRWVMIALRQMYFKTEAYGTSCYRLLSKNGEFIYVRTVGYLELPGDPNLIQSFICINTLVSKEEGEKCIGEMKKQFAPLVNLEAGINAIADTQTDLKSIEESTSDAVEDPNKLKEAIQHLIQALPDPNVENQLQEDSLSYPEKFAKCAALYKSMPPIPAKSVDFPVPTLRRNSSAGKYDRPSVLRVTQSNTNTVSVVVPTTDECQPNVVKPPDKQKRTSESCDTVLKRPRPEECSVIVSDPGWATAGVIKQRTPPHHRYEIESKEFMGVVSGPHRSPLEHSSLDTDLLEARSQDYFPNCLSLPNLDDIEQDDINHLYNQGKDIWEAEEGKLEQELVRGQMELKGNIQYQERQISAIKNDLTRVPITAVGGHKYRNTFSHLKAEHRKQQQMLRTLQQDHQNIQHCKDHLSIRGAHQDIGV